jgi:uncharacterized protein YeaO (DUF488 family)
MKNIATKSIHKKKSAKDGLRICVMRRIHPEYDFDIWMPRLAPSEELLQSYVIRKDMKWREFSKQYRLGLLQNSPDHLDLLVEISSRRRITLLCTENSYKRCHRQVILEEVQKRIRGKK